MVYLDTNILLEVLLPGRYKNAEAVKYISQVAGETCVSMLTVHLIYHFCRQYKIGNELLEAVLGRHTLVAVTPEDYQWALKHEVGQDFEDALQVAAAVRMGCSRFVTLDRALARDYKRHLSVVVP